MGIGWNLYFGRGSLTVGGSLPSTIQLSSVATLIPKANNGNRNRKFQVLQ